LKITHIYHSGFCVEMERSVCIFDWYTGKIPEFDPDKEIYVFVSHIHPDHYGKCIWGLQDNDTKVQYILDKKIPAEAKENIKKIRGGESLQIENLKVTAFRSTDTGVAFLVELEGKLLFHAGDLNAWCWKGEQEKDNKWQIGTYQAEIKKLAELLSEKTISVSFLPLDPRLEEFADLGMLFFLEHIKTKAVFPMHYGDKKIESEKYISGALQKYQSKIIFQDVTVL